MDSLLLCQPVFLHVVCTHPSSVPSTTWSLARTITKRTATDKARNVLTRLKTQLRAVKASNANLTTKTGSRKAGRGFCIAKLSGTQWRECGCCYTYTQITHRINVVIALGLSCSNSYLHVKGHLRAALGFSAFPKRCDRALSLVSATYHTHHPQKEQIKARKRKSNICSTK